MEEKKITQVVAALIWQEARFLIAIGKRLENGLAVRPNHFPPAFPPLHTGHEIFISSGVPSS